LFVKLFVLVLIRCDWPEDKNLAKQHGLHLFSWSGGVNSCKGRAIAQAFFLFGL
jgi:hypothetical protein